MELAWRADIAEHGAPLGTFIWPDGNVPVSTQSDSALRPDRQTTPDPSEWPALMERSQAGDQHAYRQLLGALVPAIHNLVRRRVFDDALADDVVQETLLTMHRVRHTYDPARPLLPWIAAIAAARAIDALRRQGRIQRREVWNEATLAMELDPDGARPMEQLANRHEVERLLDVLPTRQRQAVEMVKLQQMSVDHAAQASHLSVPAIKALLHRALARMRQHGIGDHG